MTCEKTIKEYYSEMGVKAYVIQSLPQAAQILVAPRKDSIVISDSRFARGLAKGLGIPRKKISDVETAAKQYFALKDAFLLLAQKGIPVYFYNRIGLEKNGYPYSSSARIRMENHLSFPVMAENIQKYEQHLKELFGEKYSAEYVKKIAHIPQVIKKGNLYCHEDCKSEYVNVVAGKRITVGSPASSSRHIHVYGRCGAFGYAVEDGDTIPSQLQKCLIESGEQDISVVNHGLWGGENECVDCNFLHEAIGFRTGDIVLFYRMHFDKRLMKHLEACGVHYKEITDQWHGFEESTGCFYDKPGHMNNVGYRNVAKLICSDLLETHFKPKPVEQKLLYNLNATALNRYLKETQNTDFEKEIREYTEDILKKYPLNDGIQKAGSIVMNCNPFTKGHRYLIEKAASMCDRLYIFVVEEDKSLFRYLDRFQMVVEGTSDLLNVVAVPSGNFIISTLTFPEYFMKDYVKEKNFDVSMDVEIFCKYIAPPLRICYRFAGEEPFDPVTSNYNENMKEILPQFDMEFFEIPRLKIDDNRVINATEVRRLLKEKELDTLRLYVPETTMKILIEKYVN